MQPRTIEAVKDFLLNHGLYITIITLLLTLLIHNYYERLILEKELELVNNELHVRQVSYERRQKEYFKEVEQRQAKLEQILKEIKSRK